MATSRTYGDGCSIARGLDVIGERWALLVVRELLLGPKRFTDLRRGLPRASPNVLSERLAELERAGVVRRRTLPPPAGSRVYELTEWGLALEETVLALGHWASQSPSPPREVPIASADSIVLALRARFDARAAAGLRATYELQLDEDRFWAEVADAQFQIGRGVAAGADASIATDNDTLASVLWGGRTIADAERGDAMVIAGDRTAAKHFVRLFPASAPAPTASA